MACSSKTKNLPAAQWRLAKSNEVPVVSQCLDSESNLQWLEGIEPARLLKALDDDSTRLMVYHAQDALLAFAYLNFMQTNEPKLEEFAVFSEGKGFGTQSMVDLIEYLRGVGLYDRLWLHVVTHNDRAIHIYEKLGFGDQSIVPGGWTNRLGENVPIYRYWRDLSS